MTYEIIKKNKIDRQLKYLERKDYKTFLKVSKVIIDLSKNPHRKVLNLWETNVHVVKEFMQANIE